MENQTELKWYQKPAGVIILLIFFFPVGLYLMWKNELWSKQTRWIVTGLLALVVIANAGNDKNSNYSFSNGEGVIKHNTGKDWDKDAMYRKMGEEVWQFSQDHPDATKLTLIIIDECKNMKGEVSNYETKIIFNSSDISEYSTYKESASFNKNCYDFGIKLLEWHPCGNSPF
jgi:hypothetical protein